MDAALHRLVLTRLAAAPPEVPGATELVIAACEGPEALLAELEGSSPASSVAATVAAAAPAVQAGGAFLASIGVEGFRGIGPRAVLPLEPLPGLTLVVGRNGTGKSSFSEALELLLTGTNRRWEGRSEIWRQGWRNLHHQPTRIDAEVVVEGRGGRTTLRREWPPGAELTEGATTVGGRRDDGLSTLGWSRALSAYRPFLPHNELGALWDEGPTRLHDALAAILGLEDVTALLATLSQLRRAAEGEAKAVAERRAALRTMLETIDDERAERCRRALEGRTWDLDAVDAAVGPSPAAAEADGLLALLRALTALPCPPADAVATRCAGLRDVAARLVDVGGTDAGRARATADLLEAALRHVRAHGGADCPVCGTAGATGPEWQAATTAEVARLRRLAADADAVHREAQNELRLAHSLLGAFPPAVRQAAAAGIDAAPLLEAWTAWLTVDASAPPVALADHLERAHPPLLTATANVRTAAEVELRRREEAWRPVSDALRAWLPAARAVAAFAPRLRALKAAEGWVKEAERDLRAERFAPVAAAVEQNWATLRQDSSVVLDGLRLEGAGRSPARRLVLDVAIDGESGQALGVMSQGELNALALSLFLPRASLPESPFRFIVIDDPVQAMDPSKVDGLARVLEASARTHQVVVFTHDERLPAAVRRLGIAATVHEVLRREGSAVELRPSVDPVSRHVEDAFAVANDPHLPAIARRVVPMFCRLALEAACSEVVLRRRLGRGVPLADAETELAAAQRLTGFLSLALYDEPGRGGDVPVGLQNRWGLDAQKVYGRCNRGAHGEDGGDLVWLCRATERLARSIRALP